MGMMPPISKALMIICRADQPTCMQRFDDDQADEDDIIILENDEADFS